MADESATTPPRRLMSDPDGVTEVRLPPPAWRSWRELVAEGPGYVIGEDRETPQYPAQGQRSPELDKYADEPKDWVSIPLPPPVTKKRVWHYTDAVGAIGILTSSTIRAGALFTLNDFAEFSYGRDVLDQLLSDVLRSKNIHPQQKEQIEHVVARADTTVNASELFVLCASEAPQSLAQWRAYGGQQGHALSLDPRRELTILDTSGAKFGSSDLGYEWRRVLYNVKEQQELLLQVLGFIAYTCPVDDTSDDREMALQSATTTLVTALAHCKDPSFHEEREARMVLKAPSSGAIQFRAGRNGVSPYIELTGTALRNAKAAEHTLPLPIKKVAVGPFHTRAESAQGIRLLLRHNGYPKVGVEVSDSPHR